MVERREDMRDKVIYGGVTSSGDSTTECIVRSISKGGARLEFQPGTVATSKEMMLKIARTNTARGARIVWSRDNIIGVAFNIADEAPPVSNLGERLRISELKKRKLQQKINELLGGN